MGLSPETFDNLTAYRLRLIIRAFNQKQQDRAREARWLAWHTAVMTRANISFSDFVGQEPIGNGSPEAAKAQLLAQAKAHNSRLKDQGKNGKSSKT